jgi:hypothetical protein
VAKKRREVSPQHNELDEEDHWSPPIIIADDEAIDHSPYIVALGHHT